MKKNNGFTLIELIAVITLLAIIVLVTVPVLINTLSNTEQKQYEDFKKLVTNAAELYVERNRDLYPELNEVGNIVEIDADILIEEGYLSTNLTEPIKNKPVSKYKVVVDVKADETFEYKVVERKNFAELATTTDEVKNINACVSGGTCKLGTKFALEVSDSQVYNFYVIADDGEEVTLIMDSNLDDYVLWINEDDYKKANNDNTTCNSTACNDEGPITALNYLEVLTKESWTNIPMKSYTYNGSGVFGSYNIEKLMRVKMLDYEETVRLKELNGGVLPMYLYGGQPYWLASANTNNSNYSYAIHTDGNIYSYYVYQENFYKVRPVIEISRY